MTHSTLMRKMSDKCKIHLIRIMMKRVSWLYSNIPVYIIFNGSTKHRHATSGAYGYIGLDNATHRHDESITALVAQLVRAHH